jgi:subtilase family serine protease
MFLRVLFSSFLASGVALAASSRPVCPGPSAPGDARCHSHVVVDGQGNPNAAATPAGYGPAQFQGGYGLPSGSTGAGAGQTIGIVDAYDDPNIESDLGVYSSQYGLPPCTTANGCFKKVNQTGGTSYPAKNAGWALEISLDVEIAHAVCPNCKILLVEASSTSLTNLLAAEATAVKLGATVVSNSWGASESSGETSNDSAFNHPGIPITVSSGDNGYGVEWPAASQYVTAVGGTTLTLSGNSYVSETVWSGAGSGCSAYEPKPSWQKDTGCAKRTVADVAADADPNTGAAVYDSVRYNGQSGWFQVGGTSLASPLIAAVYALAGNGTSVVFGSNPYSFAGSSNLHDVTSGSNGSCGGSYLCTGTSGYDGPTGVGTPNGTGAF